MVEGSGIKLRRTPTARSSCAGNGAGLETGLSRDERDLAYFGKLPQLKRNFGMMSIVGLTCTLVITWEGALIVAFCGLPNGGPTGLIWGYIFSWIGNILQALVMAEMGSMIPLAGGQYNWVASLAPPSCKTFLSYLTGWVTVIGWQAVTASASLICGNLIQGLIILNYPDYQPHKWQATLIGYAAIVLSLFINTYLAKLLPIIESMIFVVHLVGFFAVLIPLVYLAPKGTIDDVFRTFTNEGGWPSEISFFVGATTTMFAFIGIDAATHMAEEIKSAATIIPRSMVVTVVLNGTLGFAMLIATLFCLGDLDAAFHTPTKFPFIQVFYGATNSIGGATSMACICLVTFTFTTVGVLATTSRVTWAFAREKGVPGYSYISQVHTSLRLPVYAIAVTVFVNMLLLLVNINSIVSFYALTSLTVAAFYSSFILAAVVMLYKVLTTPDSELQREFPWGPFKMWDVVRVPVYACSIAYSLIGFFFSFWPPAAQVTPETMNWNSVVFAGSLLLAMVYWAVYARWVYKGLITEVNVLGGESF